MTERFIVDDAGTLIDIQTRDTFDYVSDVCDLLNEQHEEVQSQSIVIKGYQERNDEVFKENKQLKQQLNRLKTINEVKRETIKFHVDGYNRLKQTILEAYETERTELGKSVLKQLLEQIQ